MAHFNAARWGKGGLDVATEPRFREDHFRVYMLMAANVKRATNICSIGQRLIAETLAQNGYDISRQTVGRRQEEMEAWGFIKSMPREKGQRQRYEMLSPCFASQPRKQYAPQRRGRGVTETVRKAASAATLTREEVARILA